MSDACQAGGAPTSTWQSYLCILAQPHCLPGLQHMVELTHLLALLRCSSLQQLQSRCHTAIPLISDPMCACTESMKSVPAGLHASKAHSQSDVRFASCFRLLQHAPGQLTAAAAHAPALQLQPQGWPVLPDAALLPQLEHAQHHQQQPARNTASTTLDNSLTVLTTSATR